MSNAAPVFPLPYTGPRSGLLYLRDKVADYFFDAGVPAVVAPVGLKYRFFNLNQSNPANANRVVFIPGAFSGGNAIGARSYGSISRSTRNAGQVINPREIAEWERPFTVSIWAAPVLGAHEREDLAVGTAEDLLEQTVRGLNFAGKATLRFGDVTINAPPLENSFGVELLLSMVQVGPLYDVTLDYVQAKPGNPRGTMT